MASLKARPTTYRGISMRSRLEARYAAMLDRLVEDFAQRGETFRWEYEPRAFASRQGQYLPDFALYGDPNDPEAVTYIEVKPSQEQALAALGRMQIIWESAPAAALWAESPEGLFTAHGKERDWKWRTTSRRLAAF